IMDSTPQSSNFLARSTTSWPVSLLQPSVATLPSLASSPTMMWPPKALQASFRQPGVFTKGGGLVHIALFEAYAVAVFEVDGGDEQHGGEVRVKKGETQLGPNGWRLRDQGFQCRKLRYRAKPCSALFSG